MNCCVWHLRNEVETHCLDLPPTNLLDRPDLMELLWFTAKDGKAWGFCWMFKGCNTGFWDFKLFLMSQADAARIWPNPSHHHYTGSTPWVRLATVSIQPWMYQFKHHPWSMTIDIYKSYMNKTYTTYLYRNFFQQRPIDLTSKDALARQSPQKCNKHGVGWYLFQCWMQSIHDVNAILTTYDP